MESKEIILYEEKPLAEFEEKQEEIRIFQPERAEKRDKWTSVLLKYWRFAAVTVAFAAIFFAVWQLSDRSAEFPESETSLQPNVTASASPSDTMPPEVEEKHHMTLMNESEFELKLEDYMSGDYSLSHLSQAKILIVHSHNSEYVSESISVAEAGSVIGELLKSAGINVEQCDDIHDAEGNIGAYSRMNESVKEIIAEDPEIAIVIDIHDSDSGLPFTFTVGAESSYGWEENLRLACALYSRINEHSGAMRILPRSIGQNTGVLTLNIGLGGSEFDDSDGRAVIASFAEVLIEMINGDPASRITVI